jgi:hypothetical protein
VSDTPYQSTAKSRRCYHRVISGIERGGQLRFLTLTSSKDSPDTCQRSFRILYMRLLRRGLIKGYIKCPELSKNGKQHLHVLFRGSYIEQALISAWWQEIHKAKIVDVRKLKYNRSPSRIASYMAKYMSKENLYRYSWSWGWVWRGFVRDWQKLKKLVCYYYGHISGLARPHLIILWRSWLRGTWKPDFRYIEQPP